MRWVIGVLVALGLALPAAAQECSQRDMILSLAGKVLEGRASLGRFQVRNYGTKAVYLQLKYGAIDRAQALAALQALAAEGVRDADEAAAALIIADQGVAAGLATLDPDPARALLKGGYSTARAVLLADGGESFFRLILDGEARLDTAARQSVVQPVHVMALISDQPDDMRLAIAKQAEAAGKLVPAALLYADLATLDEYKAFVARHVGDPTLAEFALSPMIESFGATLRNDTGPVEPPRRADSVEVYRQMYHVMRTAYVEGHASWLPTFLNQSGETEPAEAAALAGWAVVQAGIDPVANPEAVWAAELDALMRIDAERLVWALNGYNWPGVDVRHYGGKAVESLRVVLARQLLAPVARGDGGLPVRPPLLGEGFDWDSWMRMAGAVSAGMPSPTSDTERVAAIELLDAVGRTAEAATLAGEGPLAMPIWRDLMQRLDRRCGAHTAQPGQSIWLGGAVVYRF